MRAPPTQRASACALANQLSPAQAIMFYVCECRVSAGIMADSTDTQQRQREEEHLHVGAVDIQIQSEADDSSGTGQTQPESKARPVS